MKRNLVVAIGVWQAQWLACFSSAVSVADCIISTVLLSSTKTRRLRLWRSVGMARKSKSVQEQVAR